MSNSTLMISVPYSGDGSKNRRLGVVRGRLYKTSGYAAYMDLIATKVREQLMGRSFSGRLDVTITLYQADNVRRDCCNLVDVVCDALVVATGLDDSRYAGSWSTVKAPVEEPTVEIILRGNLV